MSSKLNAIMTPRESVALSKWSGYVYAINDTITSLDYCGGECYFRKNDPCHFYAIHENTCYLGNFDTFNEILSTNNAQMNIYMNQGKICEIYI